MKFKNNVLLMSLLIAGLNTAAHANVLTDEWAAFRTHPRLEKAFQQYKKQNYVEARRLLEEVRKIDPNHRQAVILLAQTCEKTKDLACLTRNGEDWFKRHPDDALGPFLIAGGAYFQKNFVTQSHYAELALKRKGIAASTRHQAANIWIRGLIQQGKNDEANAALAWAKANHIEFSAAENAEYKAVAVAPVVTVISPNDNRAETSKSSNLAKQPKVKPVSAGAVALTFPHMGLPAAEQHNRIVNNLDLAVKAKQWTSVESKLDLLKKKSLITPKLQENLALMLQEKRCSLLLELVPPAHSAKVTTEKAQLAAAYCSKEKRSAQHFAAANQLRQQAGLPLSAKYLRAEGDALYAAKDVRTALQRWDQSLQLEQNPELAKQVAALALAHPEWSETAVELEHNQSALPAGAAELEQARQAQQAGDLIASEAAYQRSLAEVEAAGVWYELAAVASRNQHLELQGKALARAVELEPSSALYRAEYGYWLKNQAQWQASLEQMQTAIKLEPTRAELQPDIALLEMRLDRNDESIRDWRGSIDSQQAIQARTNVSGDAAAEQVFGWQRNVQTLEDRWSWSFASQTRLNENANSSNINSPVQYAQYGSYLWLDAAYRLDPILDGQRPTWIIGRAAQTMEDQSFKPIDGARATGLGVRQRLFRDVNITASAEWVNNTVAEHENDLMLRLSGSHSIGTDWQPTREHWTMFNIYADYAYLAKAQSYYSTVSVEVGEQFRLPLFEGRSTLTPYLGSSWTMTDDNSDHLTVSKLDVAAGLALQTWHRNDPWRAPDLRQRLALEVRKVIGGNTEDKFAVQLNWSWFH